MNIPAIGQPWPEQGGFYAGIMRGENGQPDYHLIVSTSAGHHAGLAWGCYGLDEPQATGSFDGKSNTDALCRSGHDHPAAHWAASLNIDGHSDFYLPSRRELHLCWVNVPELFEPGWYWSSTQHSDMKAWDQAFDAGNNGLYEKAEERCVRAIRRVMAGARKAG